MNTVFKRNRPTGNRDLAHAPVAPQGVPCWHRCPTCERVVLSPPERRCWACRWPEDRPVATEELDAAEQGPAPHPEPGEESPVMPALTDWAEVARRVEAGDALERICREHGLTPQQFVQGCGRRFLRRNDIPASPKGPRYRALEAAVLSPEPTRTSPPLQDEVASVPAAQPDLPVAAILAPSVGGRPDAVADAAAVVLGASAEKRPARVRRSATPRRSLPGSVAILAALAVAQEAAPAAEVPPVSGGAPPPQMRSASARLGTLFIPVWGSPDGVRVDPEEIAFGGSLTGEQAARALALLADAVTARRKKARA